MDRPTLTPSARIGILNRGEAARRFVRALRELNALEGSSLQSVALYVEAEESAPFVREADLAFPLAGLSEPAGAGGVAYMDRDLLLRALARTGCSAAWVGWGFLSEEAELVEALEERGVVFLGPPSAAMRLLGDKISAKRVAESAAVPILPWSGGPVASLSEAVAAAGRIGYPCIVKAASAGGGRGIRFARSRQELPARYASAREETLRITGGELLFLERLVERGRHLEVQVLADRHGGVHTFGVRDCSVQRRNQKIIEETPPAGLPPSVMEEVEGAAARMVLASGYESAGTVEFIYDLEAGRPYFMEVNTRLQVEHPVTEQAWGVDLVRGQLEVAMGRPLGERPPRPLAAAMEVRLNAEDPERDFSPAPGRVARFELPAGPGIRVDAGVGEGSSIPREFDSMIAKLIAYGPDRPTVMARLERALQELRVRIQGGTTNRAFLLELLRRPEVVRGGVHTRFVEELLEREPRLIRKRRWDLALIVAGIEQYLGFYAEELANFRQQLASGGYPRNITSGSGREVSLRAQGRAYRLLVQAVGPHHFHLSLAGTTVSVEYLRGDREAVLVVGERRYGIQTVDRGTALQVEVDGVPYAVEPEEGGTVKAPSPAIVLSLPVPRGGEVAAGEILATLEAMKMEMVVPAARGGTVREIYVRVGEQVAAGQPLLLLEAGGGAGESPPGAPGAGAKGAPEADREAVSFRLAPEELVEDEWRILEQALVAPFLGYDHEGSPQETLERLVGEAGEAPERRAALARLLRDTVRAYNDVERLFASPPIQAEGMTRAASYQELLAHYIRRRVDRERGLPDAFVRHLRRALAWYLPRDTAGEASDEALLRLYKSHARLEGKQSLVHRALFALEGLPLPEEHLRSLADALDELALLSQPKNPSLSDAAVHARYQLVDRAILGGWRAQKRANVDKILGLLDRHRNEPRIFGRLMRNLVDTGYHVLDGLVRRALEGGGSERELAMEVIARRMNRDRETGETRTLDLQGLPLARVRCRLGEAELLTLIAAAPAERLREALAALQGELRGAGAEEAEVVLLAAGGWQQEEELARVLAEHPLPAAWAALGVLGGREREGFRTFRSVEGRWQEDTNRRGFNPRAFRELRVHRFAAFQQELLYESESVHLLLLRARDNPRDERLFALVEVPTARIQLDGAGRIQRMVGLEEVFNEAVFAMRAEQARRKRRLYWNRIIVHVNAVLNTTLEQNRDYAGRLAARTAELGMERLVVYSRRPAAGGGTEEVELIFENVSGSNFTMRSRPPSEAPLEPVDAYVSKVVRARQRGTLYPYEILKMITRPGYQVKEPFPRGEFEEHDVRVDPDTGDQEVESVRGRAPGRNEANVVFGIITHHLPAWPRGLKRVLVLSDPTADMGSLAEPECRRVIAAIDLAERSGLPLEWLPVSAGARIDMQSGTENLDWTARVLRRIVEFTQRGGEINIIVAGINIGAQSYWNAEATMLMHTRGLLVMTEEAAMLLTGKKALDFSGSVSAEDNVGIGGVERVMGPNGQSQVRAATLYEAYMSLFRHYELTYREPGQPFPPRQKSSDPPRRDICLTPYRDTLGQGFATVGDIFSRELNPERKKPFDMRQLIRALADQDAPVFERWAEMKDAEIAVVWETRIGGYPCALIGIESRPLARIGEVPHDGPESWTGATLFPLSSKKIARAVNVASGRLPLVILANLSGFDGSPESLRKLQLEYGAEIGRAVVNFQGPIIFVVTARYHGGAYVVFSRALNPGLHAVALEGAYASVIGGAPAAAVVFPGQVLKETYADPRIREAQSRLQADRAGYQKEFDGLFRQVQAEKQSELARRFDGVHSVERARQVGSIDAIIRPAELRPYVIRRLKEGLSGPSAG